jgi:hypothetical protein
MTDYLTCAETATLVRTALKRAFPGVKFSVRSSTYSGGASIRVGWTDGPRRVDVERIAQPFAGADFDSMTDCKSNHPISVNGMARNTRTDFIFCERAVTDYEGKVSAAGAMIRERCDLERGATPNLDRWGNEWVDNLASAMARDCDSDGGLEGAFRCVVMREHDAA